MLKERLAVANKVASDLHAAEAAIDAAIQKIGILMTTLPEAQNTAKLSAVSGDAAYGHLGAAINGMIAGRTSIVALHNELANIKNFVGLRNVVVGTGDMGKMVPNRGSLAEADEIVAVEENVAAKAA